MIMGMGWYCHSLPQPDPLPSLLGSEFLPPKILEFGALRETPTVGVKSRFSTRSNFFHVQTMQT